MKRLKDVTDHTILFEYRRSITFFEPDNRVSPKIAEPLFRNSYLGFAGPVYNWTEQN